MTGTHCLEEKRRNARRARGKAEQEQRATAATQAQASVETHEATAGGALLCFLFLLLRLTPFFVRLS